MFPFVEIFVSNMTVRVKDVTVIVLLSLLSLMTVIPSCISLHIMFGSLIVMTKGLMPF